MAANQLTLSLAYALHMLATVIWIGGLLYQSLFLLPALHTAEQPKLAGLLLDRLRSRFQPIAWLCLAILIGTGLTQMAAHPAYGGFLAVENTWAKAILFKHIAIALMILVAAYQSFVLYPRLTRSLLRNPQSDTAHLERDKPLSEGRLIQVNVMLSLIVLLLTAIARTA